MTQNAATEPINLTIPPELNLYNKPPKDLLTDRDAEAVATGAYIFAYAKDEQLPRLLLVQREAGDGRMGDKWEVPGGGCEDTDPTVIHGAAREVLEEVGLHVARPVDKVPPDQYFHTRSGLHVVKLSFEFLVTEPTEGVVLDTIPVQISREHQQFAWATEEEINADQKYPMTDILQRTQAQEAFRQHKAQRKQKS